MGPNTLVKHGEERGGERWDRLSAAWVSPEEWQRRQWAREDAAFARKANQGELTTPSVIFDSMKPTQSMGDGKIYDSKSAMRAHYKRDGFIEVGNDVPKARFVNGTNKPDRDKYKRKRDISRAVGQAAAGVATMSDETMKRRAWERAQVPKDLKDFKPQ